MRNLAAIVVCLAGLLVLASCGGKASKDECGKAVDHMIEIFTARSVSDTSKDSSTALEAWRRQLRSQEAPASVHRTLLDQCVKEMSSGQARCVTKATDEQALIGCGVR